MDDHQIIYGCQQNDSTAQRYLYDRYSGRLMTVARRYVRDQAEAEDVLQESFILIFKNIDSLKSEEALFSWMRQIVVHAALRKISRKSRKQTEFVIDEISEPYYDDHILESLSAEEILKEIEKLPEGYRSVFNLYAIDGYKHQDIAEMLNIAESTSRSQLTKARRLLQRSLMSLKSILI